MSVDEDLKPTNADNPSRVDPAAPVARLDHLVLTVVSIEATVAFYTDVLGMERVAFGPDGRTALAFGNQKINLHEAGREFEPKAARPTPGSGDLCFILAGTLEEAETRLKAQGIAIEAGPVPRTGASGPLRSIYVRDPDGNLVELSARI